MVMRAALMGAVALMMVGAELPSPIQLVRPIDSYTRLEVVEEGINFLRALPSPIAVISAVGAIHTGKSFLLNQLCDHATGFSVGYTVRPETHGVWAMRYQKPVSSSYSRGKHRSYISGPPETTTVLFLDTEGLFSKDASSSYDARLFAITTLLSSEVIYNTVKFIDTHHMEALETLIRRTNLFGLRAYAARGDTERMSNLSEFLRMLVPSHLSWVVQDFVQDLENREPEAWLQQLLSQERGTSIDDQDLRSSSQVNNFFKSIDCITLPIPTNSHELLQKLDTVQPKDLDSSYVVGITTFRDRLLKRAAEAPKMKSAVAGGTPMTGADLADLLTFLVEASNGASNNTSTTSDSPFPEIESVAEQFLHLQLNLMKSDILTIVERDLRRTSMARIEQNMPMGLNAFEYEMERQADQAAQLWNATITGVIHHKSLSGQVAKAEKEFMEALEDSKEQLRKVNADLVQAWCQDFVQGLLNEIRNSVHIAVDGEPKPVDELLILFAKAEAPVRQRYRQTFKATQGVPEACDTNEHRFQIQLDELRAELEAENEKLLKHAIDEANLAAIQKFQSCAKGLIPFLGELGYHDLREKLGSCRRHALDEIETHVARYPGVSAIQVRRSEATNRIETEMQGIFDRWAVLCADKAMNFIGKAQRNLQLEVRRMVPFPADSDELSKSIEFYANEWRTRYKREVICSGTDAGRAHDAAFEQVIIDARKTIEHANIQALREIHGHAFKDLKEKLEGRLTNYFWWPTLSAEAERMALELLRAAWHDFNDQSGSNSGLDRMEGGSGPRKEFSDDLMRRTATTFVTEDLRDAHLRLNLAMITRQTCVATGIGLALGGLHRRDTFSLMFLPLGLGAASVSWFSIHMWLAERVPLGWVPDNAWTAVALGLGTGTVLASLIYWLFVKQKPKTEKFFCDQQTYPTYGQPFSCRTSCPMPGGQCDLRSPTYVVQNPMRESHRSTMGHGYDG